MTSPLVHAANEGHPLLAALLAKVPRIHKDLPGWAAGQLVPALESFATAITDAQIATALSNLRAVLRERAKPVDSWLGDIAELGTEGYAGGLHAMPWASGYKEPIQLPVPPLKNRTVVEQARQLRDSLLPAPTKEENAATPPPPASPDAK